MHISALVQSTQATHLVEVRTGDSRQALNIQRKEVGGGSAVNGGELFLLALATCYCNDLYREAARAGLELARVEVAAEADFLGIGLAATNIKYTVRVHSTASEKAIADLIRHTDTVAEIHNTVRTGASVTLIHELKQTQPSSSNNNWSGP